jgi:hypothetical protein
LLDEYDEDEEVALASCSFILRTSLLLCHAASSKNGVVESRCVTFCENAKNMVPTVVLCEILRCITAISFAIIFEWSQEHLRSCCQSRAIEIEADYKIQVNSRILSCESVQTYNSRKGPIMTDTLPLI